MVFGRSKKRESWSSRPLSMILPDNVKLFSSSRKSRTILEKASHEQSGRLVEGYKPRTSSSRIMPIQEPTADATDIETQSRKSHNSQIHSSSLTDAESSVLSGCTETSTSQLSILEFGGDADIISNKPEEAPFLTLNLDDSKTSLQELTDRLGDLNATDSPPFAPAARSSNSLPDTMMAMPAPHNMDITASNSSSTLLNTPIAGLEGTDTAADAATDAASNTSTGADPAPGQPLQQNTQIAPGSAEPSMGSLTSEQTANMNRFPWARNDAIESPALDPSNRQDSMFSTNSQGSTDTHDSLATQGTQSSSREPSEYMLNSTVKVLVNRGVYIFDPSDNQDYLRTLKLSDDESFNPFEYD